MVKNKNTYKDDRVFEIVTEFIDEMVSKSQLNIEWGKSVKRDLEILLTIIFRYPYLDEYSQIYKMSRTLTKSQFLGHIVHAIMACCPMIELDLGRKEITYAVEDAFKSYLRRRDIYVNDYQ